MSKEHPSSLDYTTPLFVQHQFLKGGHDVNTTSGTGTFVRFGGKQYVVTCNHVLQAADHSQRMNLAIVVGRGIFNLSYPMRDGSLAPSFRVPLQPDASTEIDVGISDVMHAWDFLVDRKGKKAINLDDWIEPNWSQITNAKASGWLDNYKEETGDGVAIKGVDVIAEMSSNVSPEKAQFTMHSATAEDHPSLSGISGGVVMTLEGESEIPFGIVFEGYPGAPGLGSGARETYLQPGDLMVRGHVLTPTIFENWLRNLK